MQVDAEESEDSLRWISSVKAGERLVVSQWTSSKFRLPSSSDANSVHVDLDRRR